MAGLATITVGVLSDKSGVDADAIRIYQRVGLLPKPRTVAGNLLLYRIEDIDRLIFIRRARDLGFSLEAITEMLELAQKRQKNCAQIYEIADRHLADIRRRVAELRSMESALAPLVQSCRRRRGVDDCPIVAALSHRVPEALPIEDTPSDHGWESRGE